MASTWLKDVREQYITCPCILQGDDAPVYLCKKRGQETGFSGNPIGCTKTRFLLMCSQDVEKIRARRICLFGRARYGNRGYNRCGPRDKGAYAPSSERASVRAWSLWQRGGTPTWEGSAPAIRTVKRAYVAFFVAYRAVSCAVWPAAPGVSSLPSGPRPPRGRRTALGPWRAPGRRPLPLSLYHPAGR